MCICIHIRFARGSLAVVVFFIVKAEIKRSPRTDFVAEDRKIFKRYSCIVGKRSKVQKF